MKNELESRSAECAHQSFISFYRCSEFIGRKSSECSVGSRFHRVCIQHVHFHRDLRVRTVCLFHLSSFSFSLSLSVSFCGRIHRSSNKRSLAPHTAFEASLASIVLATRIPTRGKSYRDTRCASEICDRVNDAGTTAI